MKEKNSFIVISVEYVTGQSLNPKKVWRGDMQLVKTSIGTFIDTLPFDQYGKELPGYDWRQHIGGLPVTNFYISKSEADYPWVKKKNISANKDYGHLPNTNNQAATHQMKSQEEILKLIKGGESSRLELKKSAVWGPGNPDDEQDKLKMGKHQILKAIAGFSNSKSGGTLIIGVDDNLSVTGLEEDFKAKRKSRDWWEQYIVNLIEKKFESDFQPQWLNQYFIDISDKTIFVIDILPNNKPRYLDNKFYVRVGNVTQLLEGEPIVNYIRDRFPKY